MIDTGGRHSHEMQVLLQIRPLHDNDPATIAAAFQRIGWKKTEAQYRRYLEEQAAERRVCRVAFVDGRFAGYSGVGCNSPGCPSQAENSFGTIPSEAFTILGTPDGSKSSTPKTTSLLMFGAGFLGVVGIIRKNID